MPLPPIRSVFILAGESSGDLHGGNLARSLRERRPEIALSGIGGDAMAAAGVRLIEHIRHLSHAGLVEVLRHLPQIYRTYKQVVNTLRAERPDAIVLVDYPDFNIRVARAARKLGIRVFWYISPQVWAWRKGRVHSIGATIDHMLVILPFEAPLYEQAGVPVTYVGHPLLDAIHPERFDRAALRAAHGIKPNEFVLGLLPGSRRGEFQRIFPAMQAVAARRVAEHPDTRVVIGLAPSLDEQACRSRQRPDLPLAWLPGRAHDVMAMADYCLVASGTATLETALFGTPMAVLYRVHPLTYAMGRLLIRLRHFSLVNIVYDRAVVPEFLQGQMTVETMYPLLQAAWQPAALAESRESLKEMRQRLGEAGASSRAAAIILGV